MENNLQEFIAKEKQENNGIDQQEVKLLDSLLHTNTKELNEEVRNILTPENSNALVKHINTFLQSDSSKKIDAEAQQHYINILNTLANINKNVNIKNFINETKLLINEAKISNELMDTLLQQMINKDWKQLQFEWNITTEMITNFIAQYNSYNTEHKIDNKLFWPNDLYSLPSARKDSFASKLAQIAFRIEQKNNKRDRASNQEIDNAIRNYRQEFFAKCFREWESMPALFEQKTILLGDRQWVTKGIYKNDKIQVDEPWERRKNNIAGFIYEQNSVESNNTIGRKNGQQTLDIAILADWVDVGWVDFTIKIDDKNTIKWYTQWIFPDKASRDRYMQLPLQEKDKYRASLTNKNQNTTMIIWENPQNLPEWVSINAGGVSVDAKKFGSQPKIDLTVSSPEGNDETFVTINTNWKLNKENAWYTNLWQQNLFENWSHDIQENEATKLNETIKEIQDILDKNKIAKQGLLVINVESTTDKSQIHKTLHNTLKWDLSQLKESLVTLLEAKYGKELWQQKAHDIENTIAEKIKGRNDKDGNKVLAQCRAYEWIQYIINNVGDKYLNKIAFNIQNLQWDQPKRSFSMYTLWETIKLPSKSE